MSLVSESAEIPRNYRTASIALTRIRILVMGVESVSFQSSVYSKFRLCVCFITAGPITKLFAWGEEESGGHVL
jgi:hypothetical protein